MSKGPWKKKDIPTICSMTRTAGSDLTVRSAETKSDLATQARNCESLLGLFDAHALDAALIASGWTLAEEVKILTDIARGIPYKMEVDGKPEEVYTVEPRVRLAARKELRTFITELATMNGLQKRAPEAGGPEVSVRISGSTDGVMQLLARKQNRMSGDVIDVHPTPKELPNDEINGNPATSTDEGAPETDEAGTSVL